MSRNDDKALHEMMLKGKHVLIVEHDGVVRVSSNADKDWLARILDAVRAGVPTIRDTDEHQTRIIETN